MVGEIMPVHSLYPRASQAILTFSMLENDHISVSIYDLTGRKMLELLDGEMHDGA